MKKYLMLVAMLVLSLSMIAANTTVPVTLVNKSDQPASISLADPNSDPAEPTVLFFYSVDPAGVGPTVKSYDVPKGTYLVQATFCGGQSEWYPVKLTHRFTIAIPACGALVLPIQDGGTKFVRSGRLVTPE